MKVLIGTTNPSKVKRFAGMLADCDIEFITLKELGVTSEPEETGSDPVENAAIKARYYGQFADHVICNDSGLYFTELPMDDPRQPGLNIRTPGGGRRLDDEEMIEYYSALIASLGGSVTAYYLDGVAVNSCGSIHTFLEDSEATRASAFTMVSVPSQKRNPGWPLNSLSINRGTGKYFVDMGGRYEALSEDALFSGYLKRLTGFLKTSLGV